MNITELARQLKVTPQELKEKLPELGFHIGLRAIQIPDDQANKVIESWHEAEKKDALLQKIKDKMSRVAEEEEIVKTNSISIPPTIQVYRLAERLKMPITKLMGELIKNGVLASINENLDFEVAAIVAEKLGFKATRGEEGEEIKKKKMIKERLEEVLALEDKNDLIVRPPVVVVMGHVDHGKTTILDAIRQTHVADKEVGGITQKIGAYQVIVPIKEKEQSSRAKRGISRNDAASTRTITFIDTPGHETFQAMRSRGGEAADIAILVVAADDKIQPQTIESIKIIQQENLPFIVAINKIDKPEADVERVKKGLSEINLIPEDWGGSVICVPVSGKTKQGIDELLEMIILLADMKKDKLMANPKGILVGTIIETHRDPGAGEVASLIIFNGLLEKGTNLIAGHGYGRVKLIKNRANKEVEKAPSGMPVQIFGLKGVVKVGDIVEEVKDNKEFKKKIKEIDLSYQKRGDSNQTQGVKDKKTTRKSLNLILRADVSGSLEAVVHALEKINHPEVKINILKKDLGNLTEIDVEFAKNANAWLIGFNVDMTNQAKQAASDMGIKINIYQIIYDLLQNIKDEMNKSFSIEIIEEKTGKLEVLAIFRTAGKETILGGRVITGKIFKDNIARVWGVNQELKGEGKIVELQVHHQDATEAKLGTECGLKLVGSAEVVVGDFLETYREIKKEKKFIV
ncbi:MAG: translation initiation factor IF-2 [Patescibacteria group bacterium]|jgi:translation initiation factor IF-2